MASHISVLTLTASEQLLILFSLVGYSPWGHKELGTAEKLNSSKSCPECLEHSP